jgi:hypothetical protein
MDLLVPRRVAEEDFADRVNAEVDQQIESAGLLDAELKRIDPYLSIVLIGENADPDEFDYPGYWYIRKAIPGSVNEFFPLANPDGSRMYPDARVLDQLRAADLWNPRVHRSKQEAREKLRAAKVRQKKREAEQRQDEGLLAARAALRVAGDGGMTRRAWGRGGSRSPAAPAEVGAE